MVQSLIRSSGGILLFKDKKVSAHQSRNYSVASIAEEETGVIEFSLSSAEPYRRWFGTEILNHTDEAVALDRINGGSAAFLFNHDRDAYIGTLTRGWLDDGKLRVRAVFELDNDDNPLARKIYKSVVNGTLRSVSVGYSYDEVMFEERDGEDYIIATRWTPFEGSIVTVPADATVGIGRSFDEDRENLEGKSEVAVSPTASSTTRQERSPMEETLTVDKDKLLRSERERTAAIYACGNKHNCPELAAKAVDEGWSVMELRSHILEKQPEQQPIAKTNDPLGMEKKEQQRYSVSKAIEAVIDGGWKGNCFEKEVHDSLVQQAQHNKNYKERDFFSVKIPYQDLDVNRASAMQVRDQQVSNAALGGNLVETELAEESFINIFRNKSVMRRMGMRSITGLTANLDLPKHVEGVTDGQSIYWVAEDEDVGLIESRFGIVPFRPKIAGSYMYVTRSMLIQSSIPMDNFIREELAIAMALGMDWTAIRGSGIGNEPLGLLNLTGTNPIIFGVDGDIPDVPRLVQFETKIATANADERTMGWIMNPKLRGELKSRPRFQNTGNETLWVSANNGTSNEGYVNGYRVGVSNQVPANLTKGNGTDLNALIFGDYSRWICAEWGTMELAADPYHKFLSGGVRVRIIHECDMNATQPSAFSVATDVATPFSNA